MKDWFISDLHFDHGNVMKYCNRPGLNKEEQEKLAAGIDFRVSKESVIRMNNILIDGINSRVKSKDRIWCGGDVIFGNKKYVFENCKRLFSRINCKNVRLLLGNHDKWMYYKDEEFKKTIKSKVFSIFRTVDDVAEIRLNGVDIVISHYAHAIWCDHHKGAWHLYGHSHATAEEGLNAMMPERRSLDIGVDNLAAVFGEYAPVDFDQIASVLQDREGHAIDHHISNKLKPWLGKDPNVPEEGG